MLVGAHVGVARGYPEAVDYASSVGCECMQIFCKSPRQWSARPFDPAVAAASILARAEFLTRLRYLSREYGMELPKGASNLVEAAAVKLVRAKGPDVLDKVAKTHFKTTVRVLAAAGIDRLV